MGKQRCKNKIKSLTELQNDFPFPRKIIVHMYSIVIISSLSCMHLKMILLLSKCREGGSYERSNRENKIFSALDIYPAVSKHTSLLFLLTTPHKPRLLFLCFASYSKQSSVLFLTVYIAALQKRIHYSLPFRFYINGLKANLYPIYIIAFILEFVIWLPV